MQDSHQNATKEKMREKWLVPGKAGDQLIFLGTWAMVPCRDEEWGAECTWTSTSLSRSGSCGCWTMSMRSGVTKVTGPGTEAEQNGCKRLSHVATDCLSSSACGSYHGDKSGKVLKK